MTDNVTPERWTAATVYRDLWLDPDDDPRRSQDVRNPDLDDERTTLKEYLRRYRLTLELKCADLDAEQLARRSVPPSTLSLLGLVRHMAEVERYWFRKKLAQQDVEDIYCTEESPEADFDDAVGDPQTVEAAWRDWRAEIAFAERFVDEAPDLGVEGRPGVRLRGVLVHMIEEYARHCGHADLLRECIDGRVGQ